MPGTVAVCPQSQYVAMLGVSWHPAHSPELTPSRGAFRWTQTVTSHCDDDDGDGDNGNGGGGCGSRGWIHFRRESEWPITT